MTYRHIYWGLLCVGPNDKNLMTKAVKTKHYLVRIVTPFAYKSIQEALKDEMVYRFEVLDERPFIMGFPNPVKEGEASYKVPDNCPMIDHISQKDWTRYRLIRLKGEEKVKEGKIASTAIDVGKPSGKAWKKIFPVLGIYPIEKVASSIVAMPDEKEKERSDAGTGKQGSRQL